MPKKKKLEVSWYRTEHYKTVVEVDANLSGDPLRLNIEDQLLQMDDAALSAAFNGCSDWDITDTQEVKA